MTTRQTEQETNMVAMLTYGICELCEHMRPLRADGICNRCAQWAAAADQMADLPDDHPMWDRLLRDLEGDR